MRSPSLFIVNWSSLLVATVAFLAEAGCELDEEEGWISFPFIGYMETSFLIADS